MEPGREGSSRPLSGPRARPLRLAYGAARRAGAPPKVGGFSTGSTSRWRFGRGCRTGSTESLRPVESRMRKGATCSPGFHGCSAGEGVDPVPGAPLSDPERSCPESWWTHSLQGRRQWLVVEDRAAGGAAPGGGTPWLGRWSPLRRSCGERTGPSTSSCPCAGSATWLGRQRRRRRFRIRLVPGARP
jgi:hypothetical protein